jgi:2-methylcitrate dehydratase PrpD
LLELMRAQDLGADDIVEVVAHVHQPAIDVLGPVTDPRTVHQSKFSMGFVLALVALKGRAGLGDFIEAALADRRLRAFHDRVRMVLDPEIDAAYPRRWIGRVSVTTKDGRKFDRRMLAPKGDPDNTLTRAEIEDKALRLAAHAGGASQDEMRTVIERVWKLHEAGDVRDWLPGIGK